MKYLKQFYLIVASLAFLGSCGAGNGSSNLESGRAVALRVPSYPVPVSLKVPTAGIDYPTDTATPQIWRMSAVLLISTQRVRVSKQFKLSQPLAGIDYPTSRPMPLEFRGRKILVLDEGHRLPLLFNVLSRPESSPQINLVLKTGKLVDINDIASIEAAVEGIDFPTDAPSEISYVLVLISGRRLPI